MIGVSLITQFVTYPSFFEIDTSKFKSFHNTSDNTASLMTKNFFLIPTLSNHKLRLRGTSKSSTSGFFCN